MAASLACALAPGPALADRRARGAGRRRGHHGAGQPGDHRQGLSEEGAGQGDRHLGGCRRRLTTALGPVHRRAGAFDLRRRRLAADLRHQPAARRGWRSICCWQRCRRTQPARKAQARSRRRGDRHCRARRARLRPDRACRTRPDRSALPLAFACRGRRSSSSASSIWERRQREPMVDLVAVSLSRRSRAPTRRPSSSISRSPGSSSTCRCC